MSIRPEHRDDLLSRSTEAMIGALGELCLVTEEMMGLLRSRRAGVWSPDDARRYNDLRRREQLAHRRYVAGQRWHDAVRRRVLDASVTL
jgi:hypothetical protein